MSQTPEIPHEKASTTSFEEMKSSLPSKDTFDERNWDFPDARIVCT